MKHSHSLYFSLEGQLLIILFLPSIIYYGNFILTLIGKDGLFSYLYGLLAINSTYILVSSLFRRNNEKVLIFLISTIFMIIFAFAFHNNGRYILGSTDISIRTLLVSDFGHFYNLVLPICVLYLNGAKFERVLSVPIIFSRIIIVLQLLTYYFTIKTGLFSELAKDYMSFAYYGILPMMVLFINKNKSIWNFILFCVGLFSMAIIGCRGALVASIVFISIYYLFKVFIYHNYSLFWIAAILVTIIVVGLNPILDILNAQLEQFGFSSRTLSIILSGGNAFSVSEGREEIMTTALHNLKLMPDGLWGDRKYSNVYVHNWIIEILLDAGVFIGTFFIVIIISLIFKAVIHVVRSKNINEIAMLSYSLSMLCVKFLLSSSFLIDSGFVLSICMLLTICKPKILL